MTKIELLELFANGESSGVEFKRDDIRPERLAKEIVALANLQGGRILLGVEDDGTPTGIQRPNLEEWVMDTVFGHYVHPMILPFYEEELIERMRPFVSEDASEITDGVRRDRRWLYPLEALREALINAFAHRDWTRIEDIEVVRYANRLEIKSPGALPNSMTVEKMLAGQRSARNPLIVEMLRDYGYVDARGMGVRTKIVPVLKQYNGIPPDMEPTEDYLMVRMHRGPSVAR